MQIDKDDFQVREGGRGDRADEDSVNEKFFEQDDYFYLLVDATESDAAAFYCAYVTHEYTHPDVEDFSCTETDADGDEFTWTHQYEGTTGMLAHIYVGDSLLYNHETSTWRDPVLRTHNNTREETLATWVLQAAGIRRALSSDGDAHNNLTDAERTTLANHATWLESIPVRYASVDHWKIPYPETVLPNYIDPADQV